MSLGLSSSAILSTHIVLEEEVVRNLIDLYSHMMTDPKFPALGSGSHDFCRIQSAILSYPLLRLVFEKQADVSFVVSAVQIVTLHTPRAGFGTLT